MSDVCVCMRDVISKFNSEIEGSLAFCALILFMCSILCLMYSGSSLHVQCILPFGMMCLSVWRMMFVKMVYVWWWLNVRESSLGVSRELSSLLSYSS